VRFKLTLNIDKQAFGNILPINYQYEQSACIYRILFSGDKEYASWLHNNGFQTDNKQFKFFNYSPFIISSYERIDNRLLIYSDTVEWYITFLPDKSTESFIRGIFTDRVFQIGDKKSKVQFKVQSIEALPPVTYRPEMTFQTLSPICIARKEESGRTTYLPPTDPYAKQSILYSLMEKYKIYYNKPYAGDITAYDFKVLNQPKEKLITIKAGTPDEIKVKGYNCLFKINLPEELMSVLYETGIGIKGSQGFGMVNVNRTPN